MFLTLESAKRHLYITGDAEDATIAEKSLQAETIACAYLNRQVYQDEATMLAAIALVPAGMIAAGAAFAASDAAADLLADLEIRDTEKAYARAVYDAYFRKASAIRNGIVINPMIEAAMMLIMADLFSQREDTIINDRAAAVPYGARSILDYQREYA